MGDNGFWYLPYSIIDEVAGAAEDNTFPLFYDEDFVYVSAMSHN